MAIRISKNDRQKLDQAYGVNNKVRMKYNRLRNKGVSEEQLPLVPTNKNKLIDYAKQSNMSRKDFNTLLDEIVDFSTPRNKDYIFEINQHNVAIPKSKIEEATTLTKQAQSAKDEHYADLLETKVTAPTEQTIVTPQILQELGADLPIQPIKDFNPDSITSIYGLDTYLESIKKQDEDYLSQMDQVYYDNFRTAMFTIFNSMADEIVNLLDDMGLETFMKTYVGDFLDLNLDYIYDEAEVQNKKEEVYGKIVRAVEKITGEKVNTSFSSERPTTINSETGDIVE